MVTAEDAPQIAGEAGRPSAPDFGQDVRLLDRGEWDAAVSAFGLLSPFHHSGWLEAAEAHTGSTLLRVEMLSGREPIALCPLFVMRRAGLRLLASPPPKSSAPYLGPIWKRAEAMRETTRLALLERFLDVLGRVEAASRTAFTLLRLAPPLADVRAFLWRGFSCRLRYTYRIDLARDEEAIFRSFSETLRRRIRRAEGALTVEEGSTDDVPWLFGALARRFRDQDLETVLTQGYLERVLASLGPRHAELFVARRGPEIVNGVIVVKDRIGAYSWVGPLKPSPADDNSSQLLFWRAIRSARTEGLRWFEIIGAESDRLTEFKSQFDPGLVRYYEVFRGRGLGRAVALWRGRSRIPGL